MTLTNDLKYALRQLRKSPGFTAVAVLTLALGIGTCTAMFSIVHAVILKPLPFKEPDRLVWIESGGTGGLTNRTSRADILNAWRERSQSFESLAAYFAFSDYFPLTMLDAGQADQLRYVGISDNFLPMLGVPLLHGRNFSAEECTWPNPSAVILSHSFWRRHFASDPSVIGRVVKCNNNAATIVGVLPSTFDFDSVFTPGSEVDVLTPFPLTPEMGQWGNTVFGIGRLRPNVTIDEAWSEFTVITPQIAADLGTGHEIGFKMSPLGTAVRGKFRGAFFLLLVAAVCVLAIACVNLSNLLLARINERRQEIAVRTALGARRYHLVRQTLSESLLVAFTGSLISLPLALCATRLLARLKTFGVPLLQSTNIDLAVLLVTIGLTILTGIICGVLPVLYLSRADRVSPLQQSTHQRTAGRPAAAMRSSLVVGEVALACVLLVCAGLLIRSFSALMQVELGFQPQHATVWRLNTAFDFDTLAKANAFLDGAVARVAAIPGVTVVGLSDSLPLSRNRIWSAGAQGVEYPPGETPGAYPRIVDDHYLRAMQIPLRSGRFFDERDRGDAEKTIIINENLARQLWPDRDPIGQVLNANSAYKVIGVVSNVRHSSLEETAGNEMYINYHQIEIPYWTSMEMVVRSTRPPESLVPDVRAALTAYDPGIPNGNYYNLGSLIENAVAPRCLIMQLLGSFSVLAFALACIGLYGVIAYSVTQRFQEIGIRLTLGAQRGDVLRLIVSEGLRLVSIGIACGLAAAFFVTRVLRSQLYGLTARDPFTYAVTATVIVAVALLACYVPACRAAKIEPMEALRCE